MQQRVSRGERAVGGCTLSKPKASNMVWGAFGCGLWDNDRPWLLVACQNGLLAKHKQAEEMLAPIESMISKMEGMGYADTAAAAAGMIPSSEAASMAPAPQVGSRCEVKEQPSNVIML
jgi:hypothetical protein